MVINLVMAFFFGWLMMLTFMLFKMRDHYRHLISRTKRKSIDEILDEILKQGEIISKEQQILKKELQDVQLHLKNSIQKIGLTRFNAFGKAEGEQQSFVLALMNENNNGVVVNFIYIHEGIRVYSKTIKAGKGEKHELSAEEKEAVEKAA